MRWWRRRVGRYQLWQVVVVAVALGYAALALVDRHAFPIAYAVLWLLALAARRVIAHPEVRGDVLRVPTGLTRHRAVRISDIGQVELPHPFATGTFPYLILRSGERVTVPRWTEEAAAGVAERFGLPQVRGAPPPRPTRSPSGSPPPTATRVDVAREADALHARNEELQRELRRLRGET